MVIFVSIKMIFCVHLACSNHIHNSKRMWDSREIAVDQIHFSIVAHDERRRNFTPHSIDNFGKYPHVILFHAISHLRSSGGRFMSRLSLSSPFCPVLSAEYYLLGIITQRSLSSWFLLFLLPNCYRLLVTSRMKLSVGNPVDVTMCTPAHRRNLSIKICSRWVCSTDTHQVSMAYSSAGFQLSWLFGFWSTH